METESGAKGHRQPPQAGKQKEVCSELKPMQGHLQLDSRTLISGTKHEKDL